MLTTICVILMIPIFALFFGEENLWWLSSILIIAATIIDVSGLGWIFDSPDRGPEPEPDNYVYIYDNCHCHDDDCGHGHHHHHGGKH